MNAQGKFSVQRSKHRWRSLRQAVGEYVRLYGEPVTTPEDISNPSESKTTLPRGNARPIVVPPTHKPKSVANRQRILYGEPLEFRGLRYAPINEQG